MSLGNEILIFLKQGSENVKDNEKYNLFKLDITLNRGGYDYKEIEDLFDEPFSTLYPTRIGLMWHPAAVGINSIELKLIFDFVLAGAATAIVGKVAGDLYDWAKKSLSKVLNRKERFAESRVCFVFKDITVNISTHEREDILETLESVDFIIDYLKEKQIVKENYYMSYEELNELRAKLKGKAQKSNGKYTSGGTLHHITEESRN